MLPKVFAWKPLRTLFGASLATLVVLLSPDQVSGQEATPTGVASFHRMRDYLASQGGRWRAPNPRQDPTDDTSPEAFGLWFEVAARGRVLELTVVTHFESDVRMGAKSYWFWHPGQKEILYHEIRTSGGVRMGTTHFSDERTFVTLTEAVSPSGDNTPNRGENVIVSDNLHETIAFALDQNGDWVEQQALTWTRTPVSDGRR